MPLLNIKSMYDQQELVMALFMTIGFFAMKKFNFKLDPSEYLRVILSGMVIYVIVKVSVLITEMLVIALYEFGTAESILSDTQFTWGTVFICITMMPALALVFTYLCKRTLNFIKNRYEIELKKYYFLITLVIIVTALIYIVDAVFKQIATSLRFNWTVLLAIVVILIVALISAAIFVSSTIKEQKLKNDRENYKNLELYMNSLERSYSEIRKFKHDIKNVLLSLNMQIKEYGTPELIQNTDAILSEYNFDAITSNQLNGFQHIQNAYIKGLIFSKFLEAQNLGIELKLETNDDVLNDETKYFNVFRILGILIDNAIEASEKDSKITIAIDEDSDTTNFYVINDLDSDKEVNLSTIYAKGYSTKGKGRGIGLATAREIVNASDKMFLNLKVENQKFIANLIVSEGVK